MLTLENKLNFAKEGKLENKPKKKKKASIFNVEYNLT